MQRCRWRRGKEAKLRRSSGKGSLDVIAAAVGKAVLAGATGKGALRALRKIS